MPIQSLYETTGLSINYGDSVLTTGTYFLPGIFDNELLTYSHNITAFGGFDNMRFDVALNMELLEDWATNGLGRSVVARNRAHSPIWEGIVDKVTISVGAMSLTVGPLSEIANRVFVVFSDVESAAQVSGSTDETIIAEDILSQNVYGIIEKALSGGSISRTEAEDARDTYLQDNAYPRSSFSFNFSPNASGDVPAISIECIGYAKALDWFVYNNSTENFYTGTEKIEDVLAAEPNGFIQTEKIDTNAVGAWEYDYTNRTGLTVIKEVVNTGDGSGNRWLFFISDDITAHYEVIPSIVDYRYRIKGENQIITTFDDARVWPWDVRPGRWIIVTDLMAVDARISKVGTISDFLSDPRISFIESVNYTAPYTVSLQGSRIERTQQILAQYGLGVIE